MNNSLNRVETGNIVFHYKSGEVDWPGVFIRGDDAFMYSMVLEDLFIYYNKEDISKINISVLEGLLKLLKSSNISDPSHDKSKVVGIMCKNI